LTFNASGGLTFTAAGSAATNSDLAVTKVADASSVTLGSNITYTVTVLNNGPALATNVVVTDVLPTEVTFVSAIPSQGTSTQSAGLVTIDLGAIATGTPVTATIVVTTVATGLVQNTAVVEYPGDNILSNNSSTASVTVEAPGTQTNTPPPVLVVTSPKDYQVFTNADILVQGTATDVSGIQGVTINGVAAGVNGSNWSNTVTLATGTNTLTVIATDASENQNTSTQVVHAVFSPPQPSAPDRDLVITKITAPVTVVLTTEKPSQTKTVLVEIENEGTNTVVISNLTDLVDLTVQTLATNCPDAQVTLAIGAPQKKLPVKLKHKQQLQVAFDVVFDCANDPLPSTHDHPHNDFRSLAQIGAGEDTNTVGNVCPRPPSGSDPGCGDVGTNHVLGADIFTDVVVKERK
jgi:uncharacterized repeat protein (TIGR01451 family)